MEKQVSEQKQGLTQLGQGLSQLGQGLAQLGQAMTQTNIRMQQLEQSLLNQQAQAPPVRPVVINVPALHLNVSGSARIDNAALENLLENLGARLAGMNFERTETEDSDSRIDT